MLFEALTARFRWFAIHRIRDKEDAMEIAQEALATVAEKCRNLVIDQSFSAWAYQVIKYHILNYVNRKSRRGKLREQIDHGREMSGAWTPDPEFEVDLMSCLEKLAASNPRYFEVLRMSYQSNTVAEICAELKLTTSNFYSILSRARRKLTICLDQDGSDE